MPVGPELVVLDDRLEARGPIELAGHLRGLEDGDPTAGLAAGVDDCPGHRAAEAALAEPGNDADGVDAGGPSIPVKHPAGDSLALEPANEQPEAVVVQDGRRREVPGDVHRQVEGHPGGPHELLEAVRVVDARNSRLAVRGGNRRCRRVNHPGLAVAGFLEAQGLGMGLDSLHGGLRGGHENRDVPVGHSGDGASRSAGSGGLKAKMRLKTGIGAPEATA